jgi:exodeoxyribonuclease VII small subunit
MNETACDNMKFEDALTELERIVRELEDGQTGLEQSLARYEQGVALLRRCYQQLQQAEQRIVMLTGQGEDGAPVFKPFAHAPTADAKVRKDTLPLWQRSEED